MIYRQYGQCTSTEYILLFLNMTVVVLHKIECITGAIKIIPPRIKKSCS